MRSTIVIALVFALSACSYLEQIQLNGYARNPNKIYLDQMSIVSVSFRDTHRYACFDRPLLCVQRGIGFECRCP